MILDDAANAGILPKIVHLSLAAGSEGLQGFQGNFLADLVPVLEAIRNRFGGAVNPDMWKGTASKLLYIIATARR
jgi:hypothetical protein